MYKLHQVLRKLFPNAPVAFFLFPQNKRLEKRNNSKQLSNKTNTVLKFHNRTHQNRSGK